MRQRARLCYLWAAAGFPRKVWIGITSILLLLSGALNLKLFLGRPAGRGERGPYTYHPLQDMNGETPHRCPSAAWEKEEEAEETGDPTCTAPRDGF